MPRETDSYYQGMMILGSTMPEGLTIRSRSVVLDPASSCHSKHAFPPSVVFFLGSPGPAPPDRGVMSGLCIF